MAHKNKYLNLGSKLYYSPFSKLWRSMNLFSILCEWWVDDKFCVNICCSQRITFVNGKETSCQSPSRHDDMDVPQVSTISNQAHGLIGGLSLMICFHRLVSKANYKAVNINTPKKLKFFITNSTHPAKLYIKTWNECQFIMYICWTLTKILFIIWSDKTKLRTRKQKYSFHSHKTNSI